MSEWLPEVPRYLKEAWSRGWSAGKRGRERRSNPYLPSSQEEKWLTWEIARNEADPRYVVTARSDR